MRVMMRNNMQAPHVLIFLSGIRAFLSVGTSYDTLFTAWTWEVRGTRRQIADIARWKINQTRSNISAAAWGQVRTGSISFFSRFIRATGVCRTHDHRGPQNTTRSRSMRPEPVSLSVKLIILPLGFWAALRWRVVFCFRRALLFLRCFWQTLTDDECCATTVFEPYIDQMMSIITCVRVIHSSSINSSTAVRVVLIVSFLYVRVRTYSNYTAVHFFTGAAYQVPAARYTTINTSTGCFTRALVQTSVLVRVGSYRYFTPFSTAAALPWRLPGNT